jgi:thiamine-monophosphate kinase
VSDQISEFALIDWIRRRAGQHPRLPLGIGDDAAVLRFPDAADCLLAVDMLMEGVHFTIPPVTGRKVGRKALAINLSDMAAMAGRPLAALVSVALPHGLDRELAFDLHRGIEELADEFAVALAGGDTNAWDGPLVVSVTVLGETTGSGAVTRSGAKIGDWIMATGDFGGSLAGKHVSFQPRVEAAIRLHESVSLHAMIDVSDGLAADLHHILEESGTGAMLFEDAIPISDAARAIDDDRSPLDHALADGEDFELLFTVAPEDGRRLLSQPPVDVMLSHVGEITAAGTFELIDAAGNHKPLKPSGWQHRF